MSKKFEGWSDSEMREIDPARVEVQILGRVLEGHGAIHSELAQEDWPAFAEVLRQSLEQLQEADYSSCIDGRLTVELASGDPEELRPRKAGGGLTPFVMRGIGSAEFRHQLNLVDGQRELFAQVTAVNEIVGRNESGHAGIMPDGEIVYDCGANKSVIEHTSGVGEMTPESPNAKAVIGLIADEIPPTTESDELLSSISSGARELSRILDEKAWDGSAYIAQLMEKDPKAVELLEAQRDAVHGHAEGAVVIIDEDMREGDEPSAGINKATLKQLTGQEAFVINLNEFRRNAKIMTDEPEDEIRFILANLLYHTEVYKNLADGSQPVFYLKLKKD
jgi:hypothetical protein